MVGIFDCGVKAKTRSSLPNLPILLNHFCEYDFYQTFIPIPPAIALLIFLSVNVRVNRQNKFFKLYKKNKLDNTKLQ